MRRGETVTRVRDVPRGVDQYGDPLPGIPDRVDIPRCGLAPRTTSGEGEGHTYARAGVIAGYTLYAPADADIRYTDRIEARGELWEIEGVPAEWVSPYTRRRPGTVVTLRRAVG